MEYTFEIPGLPRVKGRPRFTKTGRVYTPAETLQAERNIAALYDGPMFENYTQVECIFSRDKTIVTIREIDVERCTLRGDTSNYLKLVEDGLNTFAWPDDKNVYDLRGIKQ